MTVDPVKVLLVEDNCGDARLLRETLADAGSSRFRLTHVERLGDALRVLREEEFDVVLLDLALPDSMGMDTVTRTRQEVQAVPIVVLTGAADEALGALAVREGAQDYLVKGQADGDLLARAIRYAIERKRAEEERVALAAQPRQTQKMEALGRLAGGIAHDFNNLLVPIMGLTELSMAEAPAKSDLRSNLEEVLDACERARELVEQILAFSREDEPEHHPIELHRVVSEAAKLLRATLPTTIELRQHIDKHSGAVLANTTEINQVMMNLGSNAADAMGAKGGVLEVTLGEAEVTDEIAAGHAALEPGRYLKLTVNDTGCGMDEETVRRIFDPFYTTKEVGKGTGMGLAVVHGIVTSHGGAITVASEPGRGTRFDIYFPPWDGQQHAALSAGEPIPKPGEDRASVSVLQQQHG